MGAQVGTNKAFDDMNLTPLIDVVLVVLIIMMVNIPIQIEEMGVKLPGSETTNTPPPPDKVEQLVVALYENGELALNRRLMTEEVLLYEVTRRLRPMEKKAVFIDAWEGANYGRVIDLIDLAREAGAAKVGLAKMKPAGPLPATSVAPGAIPRGVIIGSPSVVGGITEKRADKPIQAIKSGLMACYGSALGRNGELSGRMVLKVTLGPDGQFYDEDPNIYTNNVEDEELAVCVTEQMMQLQYEPLGEGKTAVISYPVLFSPG